MLPRSFRSEKLPGTHLISCTVTQVPALLQVQSMNILDVGDEGMSLFWIDIWPHWLLIEKIVINKQIGRNAYLLIVLLNTLLPIDYWRTVSLRL